MHERAAPEPAAPAALPAAAPGVADALDASGVLALQRTAGNRKTTAMLLRTPGHGFTAHQQFIQERMLRLRPGGGLSPELIRVEELTLTRMTEALRRDRRLADRELPLVLYSRLSREVLAELGRDPAAAGTLEPAAPPGREDFARRMAPFEALAAQLRSYRTRSERLIHSPWEQRVWLARENQAVQDVFNLLADRLMSWALAHVGDATPRAPLVVLRELAADQEIQALFRAAQAVPLDAEAHSTEPDVAGWAIAARLLWGFVPIAGDATDLAEAVEGWDTLFQRPLSTEERTIMLLGALLPFVAGHHLRAAGEAISSAAARLAARGRRTVAELERLFRAAEALGGEEAAVRAAIARVRRGEHLPAAETQRLRETVRRVESAAEAAPARGREPDGAGRPRGDGPGAPSGAGSPLMSLTRVQVVQQVQELLARLTRTPVTEGAPRALLLRLERHAAPGASNAEVRRLFPIVYGGLQDPRLIAEVAADVWAEARRVAPHSYNDAAVRLAARAIGGQVEDVATIPAGLNLGGGDFFTRYAGTGQRFLDLDAPALHGATTHLIQDLVVDRALREAGEAMRAEQFRALLPRVAGRGVNLPLGDEVWRAVWDSEVGGAINQPESLFAALRQVLEGLR